MKHYKEADKKVSLGYTHLMDGQLKEAVDVWLSAWELIKDIMTTEKINDIFVLQEKYGWAEFLVNFVQDLCDEMYNLGLDEPQYLHQRIKYCEEFLAITGDYEELPKENFRQSIAESHYDLGNKQECDRLYEMWLKEDPAWGLGYVSWSNCYLFDKKNKQENLVKAEKIISRGLNADNLRDKSDVVERAIDIYTDLGKKEKAADLEKELQRFANEPVQSTSPITPITVDKVGRNDPCPCGSGKKYKKCCGK